MISLQDELLNHPYERLEGDTSDTLALTLPVHRFFAEWYYDPFGQRKPTRQFTYALTLPYAVAQLDVDILQPDAATAFRIAPEPMRKDVDTRGGKHHHFSYSDLEPEVTQTFEVAYVKTTEVPSIPKSEVLAADAQPGNPQASELSRSAKTWATFAMLAGFAVIFAGGALVLRNKQPALSATAPVMPTVLPPGPQVSVDGEAKPPDPTVVRPNFCANCGRQLQITDVFCPGCGRPLQAP
jgi:hypothetical protein